MPAYSRPGVFVNTTQAPIATNAGSIPGQPVACFVADYNAGPTLSTFVTSWQEFTLLYGGFATNSGSYLPFAVYQYFANGGTGCFILRCPNTDAVQASLTVADVTGSNLLAPTIPTVTPTTGTGRLKRGRIAQRRCNHSPKSNTGTASKSRDQAERIMRAVRASARHAGRRWRNLAPAPKGTLKRIVGLVRSHEPGALNVPIPLRGTIPSFEPP